MHIFKIEILSKPSSHFHTQFFVHKQTQLMTTKALKDVVTATNKKEVKIEEIEEELKDSKLDFQCVMNELKTGTQESISAKTIAAYQRYNIIPINFCLLTAYASLFY